MTMYIYCVFVDIVFSITLQNYFQTNQRRQPLYLTNIHSLVMKLSLHVRPKYSVGRWGFLQVLLTPFSSIAHNIIPLKSTLLILIRENRFTALPWMTAKMYQISAML